MRTGENEKWNAIQWNGRIERKKESEYGSEGYSLSTTHAFHFAGRFSTFCHSFVCLSFAADRNAWTMSIALAGRDIRYEPWCNRPPAQSLISVFRTRNLDRSKSALRSVSRRLDNDLIAPHEPKMNSELFRSFETNIPKYDLEIDQKRKYIRSPMVYRSIPLDLSLITISDCVSQLSKYIEAMETACIAHLPIHECVAMPVSVYSIQPVFIAFYVLARVRRHKQPEKYYILFVRMKHLLLHTHTDAFVRCHTIRNTRASAYTAREGERDELER